MLFLCYLVFDTATRLPATLTTLPWMRPNMRAIANNRTTTATTTVSVYKQPTAIDEYLYQQLITAVLWGVIGSLPEGCVQSRHDMHACVWLLSVFVRVR